jgi:hypothetical protein
VTVVTAGAAVAALAPASAGITNIGAGIGALAAGTTGLGLGALVGIGAVSAALGSIVSQGVGVATGLQQSCDFGAVALAAVGGGVTAGLGGIGALSKATSLVGQIEQGVARGALGSAITQGIGVATGLQEHFDWVGVATAGVAGGVSAAVAHFLPTGPAGSFSRGLNIAVSGAAGGLVSVDARSFLTGTDFGDNLRAALPSIIGNTIGSLVGDSIKGSGDSTKQADPNANCRWRIKMPQL